MHCMHLHCESVSAILLALGLDQTILCTHIEFVLLVPGHPGNRPMYAPGVGGGGGGCGRVQMW